MTPSIGRIVHYVMSEGDANEANRRRTDGASIRRRLLNLHWHEGAQAHIGNPIKAGDVYPMLIVRCNPLVDDAPVPTVNGQVFLDGNDVLWVQNRPQVEAGSTDKQGMWFDPREAEMRRQIDDLNAAARQGVTGQGNAAPIPLADLQKAAEPTSQMGKAPRAAQELPGTPAGLPDAEKAGEAKAEDQPSFTPPAGEK